ncbi:hypothetical protein ACHAXR_011887 [Thalassiosira sp. AJA248-18]
MAGGPGYQQPYQFSQQQQQPLPYGGAAAPQQGHQLITDPTLRDVLNGRGQGVQRHPGNVKYRTLVFVNKGLYAKCPRADKMKISKGIVAAVRELGGRFLELDERSGIYRDIGDKKATEKTSQALREGQTKIRKEMYKTEGEKGKAGSAFDTSLLATNAGFPTPSQREISAEGYFGYSVQVLESLYNSEENPGDGASPIPASLAQQAPPVLAPPAPAAVPSSSFGSNNAAMAMALDQFPGAVAAPRPAPQAQMPPLPQPALGSDIGRFTNDIGRFTDTGRPSLDRLTNMTMGSLFSVNSVRHLLESARATGANANGLAAENDRGTIQSVLTREICDLIRQSEHELIQVERGTVDEMNDMSHEDKEVVLSDDQMMEDRVSELRFTDVTRDGGTKFAENPNPRHTDSTEGTSYSKSSLMDASIMSIPADDMSVHDKISPQKTDGNDTGDLASAELLLRFSDGQNGQAQV